MKINALAGKLEKIKCDILILSLFEKQSLKSPLDRFISGTIRKSKFKGEFGQTKLISTLGNLPCQNILLVGLGKKKDFTSEKLRSLSGQVAQACRDNNYKNIVSTLSDHGTVPVLEGTILSQYKFERKSKKDNKKIDNFSILVKSSNLNKTKNIIKKTQIICNNVMMVRDLVNQPASELTPAAFAKRSRVKGVKTKVWGRKELTKKGFNAHLAVSRGSDQEPKLVIMEYGKKGKPFILLGKGITFDAGGLNVKPWDAMKDMKMDMAGAATVLGTIKTLAELKLPVHVIGLMPLSENMFGKGSYKQGDIIKSFGGKTIEICHTDAEGRLLMADALGYADTLKPAGIIDLATLTGTAIAALGYTVAPVLGDKKIISKLLSASKKVDEQLWELPLLDEFKEAVKSQVADVANSVRGFGGGTITASAFLSNFTKSPWAHIDIAGPAWYLKDKPYTKTGGTGFGVRLLTKFFEER